MSIPNEHYDQPAGADAPLLQGSSIFTESEHFAELSDNPVTEVGYSGGWFVWALTFSAGISGLLFGYDTGVISSTLVSLGSDLSNRPLTTLDKSLVTSCTSLFALCASPLAGVLADKLGRRAVILVADALFTVGAILQAITNEVWGMIAGRSIVGLAVGSASLVTPLYISELAPSQGRGRLVTILCLFITGGQVVAYFTGWLFSSLPGGWRWMVGLGAAPAIVQFSIVTFLPETPRWLVQAGFHDQAANVLARVYYACPERTRVAQHILIRIRTEALNEERELNASKATGRSDHWLRGSYKRAVSLFFNDRNRRSLIIAVFLQALQQLSGFNCLMYFSATIFSMLSFSSPTLASLSVALTNFVFTLLAFSLIDRIGRRRILLYSVPVMAVALCFCAITLSALELPKTQSTHSRGTPALGHDSFLHLTLLLGFTVYVGSYAFGLGNVPWQQSELFPLNVRSLGSALATATNWASNFIVGLTFLPMMEYLSPAWTFGLYTAICILGWTGIYWIYPEMSGLNLEEVGSLLANGWGVDESMRLRRNFLETGRQTQWN